MGTQPPANIAAAARAADEKWHIPACVLLAQWAQESGWGRHMPGGSNNPFGEKALPGQGGVTTQTQEDNGGAHQVTATFRAFLNIEDAFDFHAEHLATSHFYAPARAHLPDIAGFCNALTGVYATDPHYGTELMAIIRGSDLEAYDV